MTKFMNLSNEFSKKDSSKVVILPLIYEGKVTKGKGASLGPKQIIKESKELEYFDCENKTEPYVNGIYTDKDLLLSSKKDYIFLLHDMLDKIFVRVKNYQFPIILGSDHSTTFFVVKSLEKKHKDFGVIVLDAHSDLREPWGKDTWHHACVSRYISKEHKILIAGVRSQDFYENEYLKSKEGKNASVIYAKELNKSLDSFKKKIKDLPKDIFISIDVDFFDPSVIKNTNTPEPGGFSWNQTIDILKIIFKEKNVIGADIVEFAPKGPVWNYQAEAYLLSKLIYKMVAFKFS